MITSIYNPNGPAIMDLDEALDDLLGDDGDTGGDGDGNADSPPIFGIPTDTVSMDGVIAGVEDISVSDDGQITVTDSDGNVEIFEQPVDEETGDPQAVAITDSAGNSYTVDSGGNVTQTAGGTGTTPDAIASADSIDFTVQFAASENQAYGFDNKTDNIGQYDNVDIQGEQYDIAWKSVETGRIDAVTASTDKNPFPESVGFKSISGELPSQPGSNAAEKQLSVTGRINDETETITAYVTVENGEEEEEVEVGQLNVKTYDKIRRNLVVVPVNSVNVPNAATLASEINRIYGQAVAEWEVTVANQPFEPQDDVNGLDDGESGILAAFPREMRQFNREFKRSISNFDNDAYYVFIVNGTGSTRKGFMPFKRQFGYIFDDNLGSTPAATAIAHELGHGAFRLKHPQSEFGVPLTDNLMHNTNGSHLRKYQWDNVHDPEAVNSWFVDDDEVAYETDGHYSTVYLLCLMMGMEESKARQLAEFTELPDTEIHNRKANLKYTWANGEEQLRTHALNNGFHSEWEFITAFEFINTVDSDVQELGRLLHKYGDVYAHSRIEYFDKELWEGLIDEIDSVRLYGAPIEYETWWDQYSNELLARLAGEGNLATIEHFDSEGLTPDLIGNRPDWYLRYVRNMASLISFKFIEIGT